MTTIGNVGVCFLEGVTGNGFLIVLIQIQIKGICTFLRFAIQLFVKRLFPVRIATGKEQEQQQENDQATAKGNLVHWVVGDRINHISRKAPLCDRSLGCRLWFGLCRLRRLRGRRSWPGNVFAHVFGSRVDASLRHDLLIRW